MPLIYYLTDLVVSASIEPEAWESRVEAQAMQK